MAQADADPLTVARAFFAAAVVRAAGGSARYLGEVTVQPGWHGDWRIEIEVPGRQPLVLRSAVDGERVYRRGAVLGWSFEPNESSSIAARLCERLAADPTPVPEPLRVPASVELHRLDRLDENQRETVILYLPGDCDRACVFCGGNYPRASRLFDLADLTRFRELGLHGDPWASIERQLVTLASRAAVVRIAWSGRDCLASPLFDRALNRAHKLGFADMWLQSPGTRLAEPGVVEWLATAGVTLVQLTAHAYSEALFDAIGGKPGAHALFWAALHRLTAGGMKASVAIPIIGPNLHEIPLLLARLEREPVAIELFFWLAEPDREPAYDALPLAMDDVVEMFEAAARVVPAGRVSVVGLPACKRPPAQVQHFQWGPTPHYPQSNNVYPESCARCLARPDCIGLPSGYVRRHAAPIPLEDPKDPRLATASPVQKS